MRKVEADGSIELMSPSTTSSCRILATDRDLAVLEALDRVPLTVRQLAFLSSTWPQPFTTTQKARERLRELAAAGLVRYWPYARFTAGQPEFYFKLTADGFRFLHGASDAPSRVRFRPVGLALHPHTYCLAEFVVHTIVAAERAGITLLRFDAESSLQLHAGEAAVSPDASFTLLMPDQRVYRFHVEMEMGTQRLTSNFGERSWAKKIRGYDAFLDAHPTEMFRVLVIAGRDSPQRLRNILHLATTEQRDQNRTLLLATTLTQYTHNELPLESRLFSDHRGNQVALVPALPQTAGRTTTASLAAAAIVG